MELHGKIIPRKDGVRVDCLGPSACAVCAGELDDILKEKPKYWQEHTTGLQWLGKFIAGFEFELYVIVDSYPGPRLIARFGEGYNVMTCSAYLSDIAPALKEAARRAKEFGVWGV